MKFRIKCAWYKLTENSRWGHGLWKNQITSLNYLNRSCCSGWIFFLYSKKGLVPKRNEKKKFRIGWWDQPRSQKENKKRTEVTEDWQMSPKVTGSWRDWGTDCYGHSHTGKKIFQLDYISPYPFPVPFALLPWYRSKVSKLWLAWSPLGQFWPCSFIYLPVAASVPRWQSWGTTAETVWPPVLNIFTIWPFPASLHPLA